MMVKEYDYKMELPYDRFLRFGPECLTERELLAIILRTGTKDMSALDLAGKVLEKTQYPKTGLLGLFDLSLEDLKSIKGIGPVKAIKLKCITELCKRISTESAKSDFCVNRPGSVAAYFMERLRHEETENVYLLCLDSKGLILSEDLLSTGSVKMSLISPREIFMTALKHKAVNIILVHNHPSGDPQPSKADLELTKNVAFLGDNMDIPLLDHIIIGDNQYVSLRETNQL